MSKKLLPWLITFCALGLGGTAAYYSIIGLSKLFAGVATAVIIMASFLEISKLTLATLLHSYWKNINKVAKIYYIISVIVLSLITSAGIYGMLSSGYQETANKMNNIDSQISLIEIKKNNTKEQLLTYTLEKENITKAITSLRVGLANNIIQYKDKDGNLITSTSSSTRNALEKQLDQAITRQNNLNSKIDELNTQLLDYETQITEIKIGNELAGELGPLKYISNLTKMPMDKIINILLLVIIFVFDPLAISLVVAANFAFSQITPKPLPKTEEYTQPILEEQEYNPLDLNGDGIIDEDEILTAKQKIKEIENKLSTQSLSGWRYNKMKDEINLLKNKIEEEETKIY
jgi:hypothetical protein